MWYGVYHVPSRTLRHASGGHPPPLLLKPSVSGPAASEQLRSPGLIVGVMEGVAWVRERHGDGPLEDDFSIVRIQF